MMDAPSFTCHSIGTFQSSFKERYSAPRQPGLGRESTGQIILHPHQNFEQAVEDLIGFDKIWVIFWFHDNLKESRWKPKVMPPRGDSKIGVFATRSPHRPNPIGLSCVQLLGIKGRVLDIGQHDLLDGTPILDLKPYINYVDAIPAERQGWLQDLPQMRQYQIEWTALAQRQLSFLESYEVELEPFIFQRLSQNPFPHPSHRIQELGNDHYVLAVKSWRVHYFVNQKEEMVMILKISSGYTPESLTSDDDKWGDMNVHKWFIAYSIEWKT